MTRTLQGMLGTTRVQKGGVAMDQREMQRNIESYVLQRLSEGEIPESVIDVARQLDVPVTMVDRAMRNLSGQGYAGLPYSEATEF